MNSSQTVHCLYTRGISKNHSPRSNAISAGMFSARNTAVPATATYVKRIKDRVPYALPETQEKMDILAAEMEEYMDERIRNKK